MELQRAGPATGCWRPAAGCGRRRACGQGLATAGPPGCLPHGWASAAALRRMTELLQCCAVRWSMQIVMPCPPCMLSKVGGNDIRKQFSTCCHLARAGVVVCLCTTHACIPRIDTEKTAMCLYFPTHDHSASYLLVTVIQGSTVVVHVCAGLSGLRPLAHRGCIMK
jgi:hypothetical protein